MRLTSASAGLELQVAGLGIRAVSLSNNGRSTRVEGSEFGVLPRGDRLAIPGWHFAALPEGASPDDPGAAAAAVPVYSPPMVFGSPDRAVRPDRAVARTTMAVPAHARGRQTSLVLGGSGEYGWRSTTVFVNGAVQAQFGPGIHPHRIALGDGATAGGPAGTLDIRLLLEDPLARNASLDVVDPEHELTASLPVVWPAQHEQYLEWGRPDGALPLEIVSAVEVEGAHGTGADVDILVDGRVRVALRYAWEAGGRYLIRRGEVSAHPVLRVAEVDHGTWTVAGAVCEAGGQGGWVGIEDVAVRAVLHPSGWSRIDEGSVRLTQYTERGELTRLMDSATLFADDGEVPEATVRRFLTRFARRARVQDPISPVFQVDGFGSWALQPRPDRTYGDILNDLPGETDLLRDVERVATWPPAGRPDYYSLDFWSGDSGAFAEPDPERVPSGLPTLLAAVDRTGARPAVWLDSTTLEWSIGRNPAMQPSVAEADGFPSPRRSLCPASEPYRASVEAGLRSLFAAGVEMVKLDNFQGYCQNPNHEHLPGVHATEAASAALFDMFGRLGAEFPDVHFVLYWGFRSPWWLLVASTLFDPGFHVEAAHPSAGAALTLRRSTLQAVNRATVVRRDVPAYCKDSLGVWLSTWKWNSGQAHGDWRAAFTFDLTRANAMPQLWPGEDDLPPADVGWLAEVLSYVRAHPDLFLDFDQVGSPFGRQAYGFLVSDGDDALLSVHNPTWTDLELVLPASLASLQPAGLVSGEGISLSRAGSLHLVAQALGTVAYGADAAALAAPLAGPTGSTEQAWQRDYEHDGGATELALPPIIDGPAVVTVEATIDGVPLQHEGVAGQTRLIAAGTEVPGALRNAFASDWQTFRVHVEEPQMQLALRLDEGLLPACRLRVCAYTGSVARRMGAVLPAR
jgi:hypothetical protein